MGLDPEDCTDPNEDGVFYDLGAKAWRCRIWAENWPAMQFYIQIMQTQWRPDYTGLDYNVLLHELDRRKLPQDDYDDLFGSMRVIERTALRAMHKD